MSPEFIIGAGVVGFVVLVIFIRSMKRVEVINVSHVHQTAPLQPSSNPAPSDEVIALIRAGKKIDAIKLYRELHHVGLKEAKDAVEQFADSGLPATLDSPPAGDSTGAPSDAEIEANVREGRMIDAIRLYRARHNCDLKSAKDAVEALRARLNA